MINRAKLKMNAKEVLKTNYWLSFAVCLVVNTVSQLFSFNTSIPAGENVEQSLTQLFKSVGYITNFQYSIFFVIIAVALILGLAFSIFIIFPLNVGLKRFFVKACKETADFSVILDVFKAGVYLKTVKTMFLKNLILTLWSLLFLIPYIILFVIIITSQITSYENYTMLLLMYILSLILIIPYVIKYYSYYQVDYIIADDLNTNWRDAINQSREMMKECRFQTFVLELSFVGWYFLGIMLCGIGVLFVNPYVEATFAQLYFDRKNRCNSNDLYSEN